MTNFIVLAPILAPLGAAFIIPFFGLISKRLVPVISLLAMTVCLVALGLAADPVLVRGKVLVYWMGGWKPIGNIAIGINISIDAWGLFIALAIALVGLLAVLYSIVYLEDETGKESYYILVMLLLAALIGFTLTGDLFNQFVWLEILSFSSFALTAFHYEERIAIEGAFKYLITNSVAALFIVVALALLYATTGALNLAAAAGEFGKTSGQMIALGLLFAGYATKAAIIPWHFWLPDAHQVAPAPISAIFSGALIKIGIYAIGRLLFTLTPFQFNYMVRVIFLGIAALSMFVGGFQMLRQESIKRILAYSSISQMGFILVGLTIGTPLGIAAACVQLLNHALSKSALFFGAGSLRLTAGISNLAEGGGLYRKMPATFGLMALAGLSLSGIPVLFGFVGKSMLETAAVKAGEEWIVWFAVFSSIFTFAGIGRLLWRVFFQTENGTSSNWKGESRPLILVATAIPVVILIVIGIFPQFPLNWFAWPSATALLQPGHYVGYVLAFKNQPPNMPVTIFPPPNVLDWAVWPIPIITAIAGVALIYFIAPTRKLHFWRLPIIKQLSILMDRWHSGLLTDYVLWAAFSTSLLLILFYLIFTMVL